MFVFRMKKTIKAGMPAVPVPSMPKVTAGDLVGGCGKDASVTSKYTHAEDRQILGSQVGAPHSAPRCQSQRRLPNPPLNNLRINSRTTAPMNAFIIRATIPTPR